MARIVARSISIEREQLGEENQGNQRRRREGFFLMKRIEDCRSDLTHLGQQRRRSDRNTAGLFQVKSPRGAEAR